MIRFLLVISTLTLYLILSIPVLLILNLVARFRPHVRDVVCYRMVQAMFRLFLWQSGTLIDYRGVERIPKDQAVLYIGNHNSYFDIHLSYIRFPGPTGYVAKSDLLKIPLLRDWMRGISCIFLDREDLRSGMNTILTGAKQIQNGISVCIFPEGTRSKDGQMAPFKEGSMKMATKAGCPIVPIAITNSAGIWERQFPKIRPVKVIVEYGEPIYPETLTREERKYLGKYTQQKIQAMLDQHKTE